MGNMSLVTYSSSEADESPCQARKKRKRSPPSQVPPSTRISASALPPLPSSFTTLYATPVRAFPGDDPALHAGRTRSVPHVPGQWITHIYVEWAPSPTQAALLERAIARTNAPAGTAGALHAPDCSGVSGKVHSFLRSELGAPAPLHISLSRTLPLVSSQRETFVEKLRGALTGIEQFVISVDRAKWVENAEGTRGFLILPLRQGVKDAEKRESDESNQMQRLLGSCNSVVRKMGFPGLYENKQSLLREAADSEMATRAREAAKCHISIAWALLGERTAEGEEPGAGKMLKKKEELWEDEEDDEFLEDGIRKITIPIHAVKVKIGNTVVEIPLASSTNAGSQQKG